MYLLNTYSHKMLEKVVLCLTTVHFYSIAAQGECTDLRGRHISHGLHYVPGPDTCTLCVCDNGLPKVCKAVLCSPPQDCRSFRVGNTCCEFICLDDVVKPAEGEAGVRVAAGGAAALVVATVALVVYRVRTHKRRRPPRLDDQRSLTSIGYISGSMGYMGGTCETALAAWKPPGNYLPRGEAPPPYDEAVAQCRLDSMRMNNDSFSRSYAGAEADMQCSGHAYVNIPRPVQQIANTQNCYNAPLLQAVHAGEVRDTPIVPHHALPSNVLGFPSTIRLTGSLGAISGRGVSGGGAVQSTPPAPTAPHADHDRPHNVPGFYTHAHPIHTSLHRTIPRISTAIEASLLEGVGGVGAGAGAGAGVFSRADRAGCGEVRRSFHRAGEARLDAGRSMPRNLNMAAYNSNFNVTNIDLALEHTNGVRIIGTRSRAHSEEQNVGGEGKGAKVTQDAATAPPSPPLPPPPASAPSQPTAAPPAAPRPPAALPPPPALAPPAPDTLPLTVDKPSCVCSYEGGTGAGAAAEEADDYRSECENCKSANSSRWVLEEGWDAAEAGGGAPPPPRPPRPPPPPCRSPSPSSGTCVGGDRGSRNASGPPSKWENWFNTIPDSDTESEEE